MTSRWIFVLAFAVAGNILLQWFFPWRAEDPLLLMIGLHNVRVLDVIWMLYQGLTLSGPLLLAALLYTTAGVVGVRKPSRMPKPGKLPQLQAPEAREDLYVVLGEQHHPRRLLWPSETPKWVKLKNLETGIIALGLPGTGKTQCVMYPVAKQLLRWRSTDPLRKIAALVLEVKGSFCLRVKEILEECGRGDDYIEISVGGKYRWNPLLIDMDPGGIAASLAMIMEQLHAKTSSEPFWTDAVIHLLEHVIMLHRAMRDYLTFVDVYKCTTSEKALEETIRLAGTAFAAKRIGISQDDYRHKIPQGSAIDQLPWTTDDVQAPGMLVVEWSAYNETLLRDSEVDHVMLDVKDPKATDNRRRAVLRNVSSWYQDQWLQLDQKVRTGVIQTVAPFLAHFVNNEEVRHTFCPPKEAYDPALNPDGKHYGKVLPPLGEMMEAGLVVGLNMSMAENPAMARTVATMLKNYFQRAELLRIPQMKMMPRRVWRYVAFICDEYHWLATCGGSNPSGDDKFFSVSREAKVIPVVATQSISSMVASLQDVHRVNSLVQLFQTKIFLRTNDPETAKAASEMCGRQDQLREGFAIGESGGEAQISLLSGKPYSSKSGLSVNHSWNQQKDVIFEPRIFGLLSFAESITILPAEEASIVYLKPDFAPPEISYFEQVRLKQIVLERERGLVA